MQRLEKTGKGGDKDAKRGAEVLQVYKAHLESFKPARTAPVSAEDKKYITDLCLLSDKPVLYVCNVDEKSAVTGNALRNAWETSRSPRTAGRKWRD